MNAKGCNLTGAIIQAGLASVQATGGFLTFAEHSPGWSEMLPASSANIVNFLSPTPTVLCIVDAEEEFDWAAPFASANIAVTTIKAQALAQKIFRRFNLVPTYAVDYAVASQVDGYAALRDFAEAGECEIGAQLHPWVTPPHEEIVNESNSFACNLPADLQRRKIETLTNTIRKNFRTEPKLFRSGRYGAGRHTEALLREFGYDVDCSVLPGPAITQSSPDYTNAPSRPYWLGTDRRVLEIPVTAGVIGLLRKNPSITRYSLTSAASRRVKLPAIFARFGLLNRVRISPEGHTLREAKALTRALFQAGQRVFAISYHSPSLEAGKTPYTKTPEDVVRFLAWIERYLEFFMGELGGTPSTPSEVYQMAISQESSGQRYIGKGIA
jgi:hypothetical protein